MASDIFLDSHSTLRSFWQAWHRSGARHSHKQLLMVMTIATYLAQSDTTTITKRDPQTSDCSMFTSPPAFSVHYIVIAVHYKYHCFHVLSTQSKLIEPCINMPENLGLIVCLKKAWSKPWVSTSNCMCSLNLFPGHTHTHERRDRRGK